MQSLGLQNAKDLSTLIRWDKNNTKPASSASPPRCFPFASHAKYGYDLDFAREALCDAGELAMKYVHRLTAHPGQSTQLGSPRPGGIN